MGALWGDKRSRFQIKLLVLASMPSRMIKTVPPHRRKLSSLCPVAASPFATGTVPTNWPVCDTRNAKHLLQVSDRCFHSDRLTLESPLPPGKGYHRDLVSMMPVKILVLFQKKKKKKRQMAILSFARPGGGGQLRMTLK